MIEVLVCLVYVLYHLCHIILCHIIIVTKLSLEAACNSMCRNRNRTRDFLLAEVYSLLLVKVQRKVILLTWLFMPSNHSYA